MKNFKITTMKKWVLFLILVFTIPLKAFANTSAFQAISGYLDQYLYISSFIIDGVDVPSGTTGTLEVKNKVIVNPSLYTLELSPIRVKIMSNVPNITVLADFVALEKSDYVFETSNLSVSPHSEDLTSACPVIISGDFIPKVQVTPSTKPGAYIGQIIFTVSST